MAIRAFELLGIRALRRAAASDLPNLVVIAGPNGGGKSTLLYELYNRTGELGEPDTKVRYLGPHRAWRKTTLAGAALSEFGPTLESYLERAKVPAWRTFTPRGLNYVAAGQTRDPGAQEEAFSFVKAAILQLDARLKDLVTDVWKTKGHEVAKDDVPDLLQPLREAVHQLLPHLTLEDIDSSDAQDLKVLFRRTDGEFADTIELDDLSSGEKAVVGLMLPLIEAEAERLISELGGKTVAHTVSTTIIDEPESHLHPWLQVLLIEHLAELAATNRGQFILATQSPTIIDSIGDGSLFLLAPAGAVAEGNQLVPVGRSQPRLELMRSLTGSTHLLTRCRPVVFLEGERPPSRPISDQRLVETLIPESKGWTLVASGDRRRATRAAQEFRAAAAESLPGVPVFALVDRDQAEDDDEGGVVTWGVSMVENLLLDPVAIWAVLEPQRELVPPNSEEDVERILREIASQQSDDEVRLRVPTLRKPVVARVEATSEDEVEAAVEAARGSIEEQLSAAEGKDGIAAQFGAARKRVEAMQKAGQELQLFRGKPIFERFYDENVKPIGTSRQHFAYAVAREIRQRGSLEGVTGTAVRKILRFVPRALGDVLARIAEELPDGDLKERVTSVRDDALEARRAWEEDNEGPGGDLDALRRSALELARELPESDQTAELASASSQLGMSAAG